MPNRFQNKTFTLIEMLVVVVIIGILAGVLVPRLVGARERASDAGRIVKVGQISSAVELYAQENGGEYPTTDLTNGSTVEMVKDKIGSYLSTIPNDPGKGVAAIEDVNCLFTGDSFAYYSDGTMYAITALMESKRGNTSNCLGVIDSDKQAGFQVVGKGLTIRENINTYDPDFDGDPVEWCLNHLTDDELAELENTTEDINPFLSINENYKQKNKKQKTDFIEKAYAEGGGTSKNNWCEKEVIYWGPDSLPNGIPSGLSKLTSLTRFYLQNHTISSLKLSNINLYEVSIWGNSLTSVELSNMPNLRELRIGGNLLSNITFPQKINSLNVISIGGTALKNLVLPESTSSVGGIYISSNNLLESITFPSSLPRLGSMYITENSNLRSIALPGVINNMYTYNFYIGDNPLLNTLGTPQACQLIKNRGWNTRVQNRGTTNICAGY